MCFCTCYLTINILHYLCGNMGLAIPFVIMANWKNQLWHRRCGDTQTNKTNEGIHNSMQGIFNPCISLVIPWGTTKRERRREREEVFPWRKERESDRDGIIGSRGESH